MAKKNYSNTVITFAGTDYLDDAKVYRKKEVKIKFYDFESVDLKIYPKPDKSGTGVVIGKLEIPGIGSFFIWENEGEYGTFWSGTIEKETIYFNVKKGLARRGEAPSYQVTFRELDEGEVKEEKKEDSSDDDLPF